MESEAFQDFLVHPGMRDDHLPADALGEVLEGKGDGVNEDQAWWSEPYLVEEVVHQMVVRKETWRKEG